MKWQKVYLLKKGEQIKNRLFPDGSLYDKIVLFLGNLFIFEESCSKVV